MSVRCCLIAEAGDCTTVYLGYEPTECTDLTATYSFGIPPYTFEWSTGETTETITVCPTITTTYTITITDGYGCVSTDEVTVDVMDVRCGKKLDKVEVCHYPPGNPANAKTLCISPEDVADHLAHGDRLGACGNAEPCDGYYMAAPGAKSSLIGATPIIGDDDWTLYPNPAYDRVSVDLTILSGHEVQVTIFDVSGKAFWNHPMQILESPVIEIGMNTIPSGIYHVVLRTDKQSVVKKLVITK